MRTRWHRILGGTRTPGSEDPSLKAAERGEARALAPATADEDPPGAPRLGSLDLIGQRNELLSVRFAAMSDRLEDLKSLAGDFTELSLSIEELAADLPRAKAKVLEVEALLADERDEKQAMRNELASFATRFADLRDDHEAVSTLNRSLREALERSESSDAANRNALADAKAAVANAERQIEILTEGRERLESDLTLANADLGQARDALARAEELTTRQANRIVVLDNENGHLNKVVANHIRQIADLKAAADETERLLHEKGQELFALRSGFEAERSELQKHLQLRESSLAALNSDNSSLSLRVDSFEARHGAQERNLEQLRASLTEKEGLLRAANESARASGKEIAALARQLDGMRQSLGEQGERLRQTQALLEETTARNDMLAKALAAKDAALGNAVDKVEARAERIEDLTKRLEAERASAEAAKRRLLEELENERSERSLAQGALKIARESRGSLQRQNEALRRANRSLRGAPVDDERDATTAAPSNVSPFAQPRGRDGET